MSHHYMENNTSPFPSRQKTKDDASTQFGNPVESQQDAGYSGAETSTQDHVVENQIRIKVLAARRSAKKATLASLRGTLQAAIKSTENGREGTTDADVYVAARAFCEEYEAK